MNDEAGNQSDSSQQRSQRGATNTGECARCGTVPRPNARFCDACGATLTVNPNGTQHGLREQKLAERLTAVAEAATQMARELDLDRLLSELPAMIHRALEYDLVALFLVESHGDELVLRSEAGTPPPGRLGFRLAKGTGIIGHVAQTEMPYLAPDVSRDPYYAAGPDLVATQSELAAPIIGQEGLLGVIDVQARSVDAFDDIDLVTMKALAGNLAVALENAELFVRLRDEEERLRAIVNAIPNPLKVIDDTDHIILMNERMRELFRLPENMQVGTMADVVKSAPPEVHAANEFIDHLPELPTYRPPEELVWHNPNRAFIRRVTPVTSSGAPRATIVLYQEVTAERAALRAKDQLLSIAAHELRTPLTALLGFLDLLQGQLRREQPNMPLVRQRIEIVRRQSRRLADLVEELLGLAQLEAGEARLQPEQLDLKTFVTNVIERFAPTEGGASRVVVHGLQPGVTVLWDEGRVDQILTNLIDNGLRYSPPGSPVDVTVEESADDVRFQVHNHGSGLSQEDLSRLFQPFSRLVTPERHVGGLGLGLYVSRTLAERHGGRLWLESALEHGVTAILALPRLAA
jgi:signal transduction histidine kinase/putative methionine-R-sulfoxide reductase with GAF domain